MNAASAYKFVFRMFMFSIIFQFLSYSWWPLPALQDNTAFFSSVFLRFMGFRAFANYDVITIPENPLKTIYVDRDCTGWKDVFFFISLVFSCPCEKNIWKSFIFLPVLYIMNAVRIAGVVWIIGTFGMKQFGLFHLIGFGIAPTLWTLMFWLLWMWW